MWHFMKLLSGILVLWLLLSLLLYLLGLLPSLGLLWLFSRFPHLHSRRFNCYTINTGAGRVVGGWGGGVILRLLCGNL